MMRLLSVIAPLLIAAVAAAAADIPQVELDWDYAECMQVCGRSVDRTQCTNYCACALQSVQEQFDLDEYMAHRRAIELEQPGDPSSVAKMVGIVSACKAETFE